MRKYMPELRLIVEIKEMRSASALLNSANSANSQSSSTATVVETNGTDVNGKRIELTESPVIYVFWQTFLHVIFDCLLVFVKQTFLR